MIRVPGIIVAKIRTCCIMGYELLFAHNNILNSVALEENIMVIVSSILSLSQLPILEETMYFNEDEMIKAVADIDKGI